ncbi:MAG: hypothetical protein VYA29_00240 [Candidatus Thermoplasmatota archaeon]|nr:hypothetical protein [Candidatus Thermoplasmatota archaeon]
MSTWAGEGTDARRKRHSAEPQDSVLRLTSLAFSPHLLDTILMWSNPLLFTSSKHLDATALRCRQP